MCWISDKAERKCSIFPTYCFFQTKQNPIQFFKQKLNITKKPFHSFLLSIWFLSIYCLLDNKFQSRTIPDHLKSMEVSCREGGLCKLREEEPTMKTLSDIQVYINKLACKDSMLATNIFYRFADLQSLLSFPGTCNPRTKWSPVSKCQSNGNLFNNRRFHTWAKNIVFKVSTQARWTLPQQDKSVPTEGHLHCLTYS